jgi:hypothetical protein
MPNTTSLSTLAEIHIDTVDSRNPNFIQRQQRKYLLLSAHRHTTKTPPSSEHNSCTDVSFKASVNRNPAQRCRCNDQATTRIIRGSDHGRGNSSSPIFQIRSGVRIHTEHYRKQVYNLTLQNATALSPLFLTRKHRLLVTGKGRPTFPTANHCEVQLKTSQSVSVLA